MRVETKLHSFLLIVMPGTQYVDDLLLDPHYFAELIQTLYEGQDVQGLPQAPEINLAHLFLFAMSLTPIFDELRYTSPNTSVPSLWTY